jgi:hypothetical protein
MGDGVLGSQQGRILRVSLNARHGWAAVWVPPCDTIRTRCGYAKKTRRRVFMRLATNDVAA